MLCSWLAHISGARLSEYHPHDTRQFRSQSNCYLVYVHSEPQLIDPMAKPILVSVEVHQTGAGTMDEQSSNVIVATFADAEERLLSSRRVLTGNQA